MILYFKSKGKLVRVDYDEAHYVTATNAVLVQAFNQKMPVDGAILRSVQKGETA